jgi:hypothetical protein
MHPSIFALGLVLALIVGGAQPGISTESQATMQQPHLIIFKDLPLRGSKGCLLLRPQVAERQAPSMTLSGGQKGKPLGHLLWAPVPDC